MSEDAVRTRISGRLTLLAQDGVCSVTVDDGSGRPMANAKDLKGAMHAEELEKARKAGHKQGFDECQKRMSAEIAGLKAQLEEARQRLPEALNSYFADLEAQMRLEIVELGFKAAEAITGAEIERRDITMDAVNAALSPLLSPSGVKIHVSASFLAKGVHAAPCGASFVSDPKLKTGEIMVDSQQGMIDGTVKSRLETLKEELLKSLSKEQSNA